MEPTITFGYNHGGNDVPWQYNGTNSPYDGNFRQMSPYDSLIVFTGGGILGNLPTPTCISGTRDATIRPSVAPFVIPQTYVEQDQMYITNAGRNTNRYVFAVHSYGTATSDIYLEAWDDNSFSTTDIELLSGTPNNGFNSCINAIRTTHNEPPWPWDGSSSNASYLRGVTYRVALDGSSTVTDKSVYFNIYVQLETDNSTFHVTPCLSVRYLYT